MSTNQKVKRVCLGLFQVVLFIALSAWWTAQLDPLVYELYLFTPPIIFACVTLFLSFFIIRTMGTLAFLPKTRLKAMLYNGKINPRFKELLVRFFSRPFLTRVLTYFVLFILEFSLRLFAIKIFLETINLTTSFWADFTNYSPVLMGIFMCLFAFSLMELPAYLLFYRLSFKTHSNRSKEYRFGLKFFTFILLLLVIRHVTASVAIFIAFPYIEYFLLAFQILLGVGLWYLMYRKKCSCCAENCCVCKACQRFFSKLSFCKKENASETEELGASYVQAEKVAQEILVTEAVEETSEAPQK